MMILKNCFNEYTESEFRKLVEALVRADGDDELQDEYLENFIRVCEHPDGSDLIYYPEGDNDGSVEAIIKTVNRWRLKNGKPGFRKS